MGWRSRPRRGRRGPSDAIENICRLMREDRYVLSDHVQEGLESGEYSRADIETSVLRGSIVRREKNDRGQSVDGRKYVITGPSTSGLPFDTVGKIIAYENGHAYFFITAYWRQ